MGTKYLSVCVLKAYQYKVGTKDLSVCVLKAYQYKTYGY